MPTLVIIILCLAIYALTLPNAFKGIEFYLIPDFSEITLEVVFNALGQAFFSLSLGMGALITYGSYVGKGDNIITSAAFITLADVGIAFIAGLMMFPFVAYLTEGTMEGSAPGAGLIFVVLPGVFASLTVWAIAILIFLLGIPSMLSTGTVESLTSFLTYPSGEVKFFMDFVENIANDNLLTSGRILYFCVWSLCMEKT
ncbi:sodium-dependent transporter [Fulvivirga imtechensis AK7]|uniref:Sodium-dependent transporter n=2 Tax=Fulvivirga TaxID=396811 RepID=L8JYN3_9BACT|nr:sodium-dependent transporter [Fulvivirga imtechensis AK7]